MVTSSNLKDNLLNYNLAGLREYMLRLGEKPYRAQQVLQWIHQEGVRDFSLMTNLSQSLRKRLAEIAEIRLPEIIMTQRSPDGTYKWLLRLDCGNSIETVFIPEAKRGTLCISSQVGCVLNCSFCSTAKQGFNRNLTTAEIIGQLWIAVRELTKEAEAKSFSVLRLKTMEEEDEDDTDLTGNQELRPVTNVVMMGMGEPLLNFDNVVTAMDLMMDDFGYGLSKRRVTLSTSGVLPDLLRLKERSPVALAVSLHAPTDALRDELVPINKKYPLAQLMAVCKDYFKDEPRRMVTFEYVMLKGVNDQLEHANQLIKLLRGIPAKINLIPFNPFPHAPYACSSSATILAFEEHLRAHKINTFTRKRRGDAIDAACGQLAGKVNDKTRRAEQWQKMVFVSAQQD